VYRQRAAPDPRFGTEVALLGGHPARLIQIGGSTEILPYSCFSPKEPPSAFDRVQPSLLWWG
jgi:hypothetical protein